MADHGERFGRVERRLDSIAGDIKVLKHDIRSLKSAVSDLIGTVGGVARDISGLRVLYEHHDEQNRTIAEVLAHHGTLLDAHGQQLHQAKDSPMSELRDFVHRLAEPRAAADRAGDAARPAAGAASS